MSITLIEAGTGTLSPTQVVAATSSRGGLAYIDIAASDTRSFVSGSSHIAINIKTPAKDVLGDIGVWMGEILTNTTARFYSTRQIDSDSTIVFDWVSVLMA